MSEYPDHLNPFKESEKKKLGRAFSRSFRELKGFIRQSFRKKKSGDKNERSEDVTLRKPLDVASYNTLRNNVMSLPSPPTYSSYTISSPPLPRSRFKERLSRTSLNNTYNSTYDEKCNPFAEEEGLNPFEGPPVPFRRRKNKKRAPLPPSCSNPDVNDGGYKMTNSSSKWSLTSSETDYTIDDKSECSGDVAYTQSLRECLDNFNKEMDALNKDPPEMGGSSPDILERTRSVPESEEETEAKIKSKSADILERDEREINNNEIEHLETTKLDEPPDVTSVETDEPKHREICGEEVEIEDKIVELKYEENNNQDDAHTNQTHSEDAHREFVTVITEENEEIENENVPETTEIYISNSMREGNVKENFDVDNIKMKYIDEENYSLCATEKDETKNRQSNNNSLNNNISKHSSPVSKQREFKLEREVMLGYSQL